MPVSLGLCVLGKFEASLAYMVRCSQKEERQASVNRQWPGTAFAWDNCLVELKAGIFLFHYFLLIPFLSSFQIKSFLIIPFLFLCFSLVIPFCMFQRLFPEL